MSDSQAGCSVSSDSDITVIRWHPKINNTLLFGDSGGCLVAVEVGGISSGRLKASKRRIEFKVETIPLKHHNFTNDAVCDVKFDPNSDNYTLIAFNSGMFLIIIIIIRVD